MKNAFIVKLQNFLQSDMLKLYTEPKQPNKTFKLQFKFNKRNWKTFQTMATQKKGTKTIILP